MSRDFLDATTTRFALDVLDAVGRMAVEDEYGQTVRVDRVTFQYIDLDRTSPEDSLDTLGLHLSRQEFGAGELTLTVGGDK